MAGSDIAKETAGDGTGTAALGAALPEAAMQGLTSEQARERLARFGPNRPGAGRGAAEGAGPLLATLLVDPAVLALTAALGLLLFAGATGAAGFAALALGLVLGLAGLRLMRAAALTRGAWARLPRMARVIRDGAERSVPRSALVPGDVVLLRAGDRVPADLRLLAAWGLRIDLSPLESGRGPVTLHAGNSDAAPGDAGGQGGNCPAGCLVLDGAGTGIVVATGAAMRLAASRQGAPAAMHRQTRPASGTDAAAQARRTAFALAAAIAVPLAAVLGLELLRGRMPGTTLAQFAVGLAVAALPGALGGSGRLALAAARVRLARLGLVVRHDHAVEALGQARFLCTDLPGVLSAGKAVPCGLVLPDGTGYSAAVMPQGPPCLSGPQDGQSLAAARALAWSAALAGAMPAGQAAAGIAPGQVPDPSDPVDRACHALAAAFGPVGTALAGMRTLDRVLPSPGQDLAGRLVLTDRAGDSAGPVLHLRGEPDAVLPLCAATGAAGGDRTGEPTGDATRKVTPDRARIAAQAAGLAERGLRVIAVATGHPAPDPAAADPAAADAMAEQGAGADGAAQVRTLRFLGFVVLEDPLLPGSAETVATARQEGLRIALLTDRPGPEAHAHAATLGLVAPIDPVVTGDAVAAAARIGDRPLDNLVQPARLFGGMRGEHRALVVRSHARNGHCLCVLGAGPEDLAAMDAADVALALPGCDAVRDRADAVLTDPRLATLLRVLAGARAARADLRRIVAAATGGAIAVTVFVSGCALWGLPQPSGAALLWLGLIAAGLRDLAFAPEAAIAPRPSRRDAGAILPADLGWQAALSGAAAGALALAVLWQGLGTGLPLPGAQAAALGVLAIAMAARFFSGAADGAPLIGRPARLLSRANAGAPLAAAGLALLWFGACHLPPAAALLGLGPVPWRLWPLVGGAALCLLVLEEVLRARRMAEAWCARR